MKYRRQQLEHEALVEHPERHVLHSVGAQGQGTLQFNEIRSGKNGKSLPRESDAQRDVLFFKK